MITRASRAGETDPQTGGPRTWDERHRQCAGTGCRWGKRRGRLTGFPPEPDRRREGALTCDILLLRSIQEERHHIADRTGDRRQLFNLGSEDEVATSINHGLLVLNAHVFPFASLVMVCDEEHSGCFPFPRLSQVLRPNTNKS
jgi:hypothetical protein